MKKKDKKQKKKLKERLKNKSEPSAKKAKQRDDGASELKRKIEMLEAVLKKRERTIEDLKRKISETERQGGKKRDKQKQGKGAAKLLLAQRSARVGLAQRNAWRRHGFLRDRYEYHLGHSDDKTAARRLAGQDLKEKFGEEAGYSEHELEQILS